MKKKLAVFLVSLVGGLLLLMAVTCLYPPAGRVDFNLRINEIECLLKGVNPFSVWNEDVRLPPYVSNIPKSPVPEGCDKMVNAYAPWEYSYMMIFALLPRDVSWLIYSLLMLASMFFIVHITKNMQTREFHTYEAYIIATVPFVAMSYLIWSNTSVGNFAVFVLLFLIIAAKSLSKGNKALAGICWAMAMVKPQSAILLVIPLLIRKQLLTCVVAVSICIAASIIPSLLCKSSFIEMILQGPQANAELFQGSGTWPLAFCGYFSNSIDISIGLIIGAASCFLMTWLLRNERDWIIYLMPACVVATLWTYSQVYSHAMCWFLVYAIVKDLLLNPRSKILCVLFVLSLFFSTRAFLAWRGFCAYGGINFPFSEYQFRLIDSLNSTVILVIAFVFVFYKRAHSSYDTKDLINTKG